VSDTTRVSSAGVRALIHGRRVDEDRASKKKRERVYVCGWAGTKARDDFEIRTKSRNAECSDLCRERHVNRPVIPSHLGEVRERPAVIEVEVSVEDAG
jgi:hypothetical protein